MFQPPGGVAASRRCRRVKFDIAPRTASSCSRYVVGDCAPRPPGRARVSRQRRSRALVRPVGVAGRARDGRVRHDSRVSRLRRTRAASRRTQARRATLAPRSTFVARHRSRVAPSEHRLLRPFARHRDRRRARRGRSRRARSCCSRRSRRRARWATRMFVPGLTAFWGLDLARALRHDRARRARSDVPVWVAHGDKDFVIPVRDGARGVRGGAATRASCSSCPARATTTCRRSAARLLVVAGARARAATPVAATRAAPAGTRSEP